MDNKDLIRQYVTVGGGIPEYQFDRLSHNLKVSYMRARIPGYDFDENPPEKYELDYLPNLPENYIKQFVSKIPMNALDMKLKLNNSIDIEIPNTDFTIEIDLDEAHRYVNSEYADDIFEKYLGFDNDLYNDGYYDTKAYTYVSFNKENTQRIENYITSRAGDEIDVDNLERAIGELIEAGMGDELENIIASSYSECSSSASHDLVIKGMKSAFEEYGEILSFNEEGIKIKANLIELINSSKIDYYDDYATRFENGDWSGIFSELIYSGNSDKPNMYLDDRGAYCDSENFNAIFSDRFSEIE